MRILVQLVGTHTFKIWEGKTENKTMRLKVIEVDKSKKNLSL